MVSVLSVGAADASNGKSEATISPRMMNRMIERGLPADCDDKEKLDECWWVKTVGDAVFEMGVDGGGVVYERGWKRERERDMEGESMETKLPAA